MSIISQIGIGDRATYNDVKWDLCVGTPSRGLVIVFELSLKCIGQDDSDTWCDRIVMTSTNQALKDYIIENNIDFENVTTVSDNGTEFAKKAKGILSGFLSWYFQKHRCCSSVCCDAFTKYYPL